MYGCLVAPISAVSYYGLACAVLPYIQWLLELSLETYILPFNQILC